ncbi:sigma-70 family RNA polymerase sigma factor [Sandaracinus amylolyticus]|uniref:sigma-70 family RNA polymerase sigma factor n=1 Tax=Sandaracinus amylolyticus TaxID=927083 RepID=UPI001F2EA276|nr:sigma-70 family RNA polymerase sigma factor [Sandaracinus amylolyticus]UJR78642.1 RNA polymerase primary sigma factor [Sandaracinus amylolyticus]
MSLTLLDRYRRDLRDVHTLDAATERDLARRWAAGDRLAGEKLVAACLPFVMTIAREYRRWGVPFEDLVQQGNLGLLRAAAKFDPDRECRLATYAATWIRGEIRDYVVRAYRIVRIGTTHTERTALRRYRDGSATSPEELSEKSGMPLARSIALWPLLAQRDTSLDAPVEGGPATVERLPSSSATPEDELADREQQDVVQEVLAQAMARLGDRERRILEARAMADEPQTLEALGREMGVSRERVRQLEERAHAALRSALRGVVPAAA